MKTQGTGMRPELASREQFYKWDLPLSGVLGKFHLKTLATSLLRCPKFYAQAAELQARDDFMIKWKNASPGETHVTKNAADQLT